MKRNKDNNITCTTEHYKSSCANDTRERKPTECLEITLSCAHGPLAEERNKFLKALAEFSRALSFTMWLRGENTLMYT